jgi:hypothetical protein
MPSDLFNIENNFNGYCIRCDEEPGVFIQIELSLCENDEVSYYDKKEYTENPVAYNSGRCKRAYQPVLSVHFMGRHQLSKASLQVR